jgi:oligopeptide transport system substrate-binding protein
MKQITKYFLIFTLFFQLVSCTKNKSGSDNTLNFPLSGQISTLDPVNSYDSISMSVVYQGYEQLYEYHYLQRPYKIIPLLAESLPKVEKNGTRYTIKIKKGIQYHDSPAFKGKTRFVKAQDFVHQFKRLAFKPLISNGWWLFDGRIVGLNEFREEVGNDYEKLKTTSIQGLQTPDDHTLIIDLIKPYPQMINALAMSFTSPVPVEVSDHFNNNLTEHMIGTGAYKLDKWHRNSKITMSRFEKYHKSFYPGQGDRLANSRGLLEDAGKRLPFIDKITFHIIKESQTRWLQFISSNLDFLRVPKDNYSSLVTSDGNLKEEFSKKGIVLEIFPTLTFWWISFNMNDPHLGKNRLLRQAIAQALDTQKYIQTFTNNIGLRATSIYPPGIPGYDPTSSLPYEYNLDKAKELLAKAGFPNGIGLPTLVYDTRGSSTTQRQKAEFIKTQLEKIGIKLKIETNTFPAYLKKAKEGKLQIWLDGWSLDYPDSENVLQLLTKQNHPPGPNATYYASEEFDKMFDELKLMDNGVNKFELMKKMEQVVFKDLPWALLYYSRDYIMYHKRLKNFRYSDLFTNKVKYLRLSK